LVAGLSGFVLLAASAVVVAGPAAAAVPASSDFVTAVSDGAASPGTGGDFVYAAASGDTVTPATSGSSTTVTATGASSSLTVTIEPPSGVSAFVAGRYPDTRDAADASHALLTVTSSAGQGGCTHQTGTLNITDVQYDGGGALAALDATYAVRCDGTDEGTFGQVHLGEPAAASGVVVAPTRVSWPDVYPGAPTRAVPVHLINAGGADAAPTSTLTMDNPGAFASTADGCTGATVAPGGSCTVTVTSTPPVTGLFHGGLALGPAGAVEAVTLTSAAYVGHTSLSIRSDAGDAIGGGETADYTPDPTTTFGIHSDVAGGSGIQSVTVTVAAEAETWALTFTPPTGSALTAGGDYATYSGTAPAKLTVLKGASPCLYTYGHFAVQHLVRLATGEISEFAATFEQACDLEGPQLRGSVTYRSPDAAAAVAPPKAIALLPVNHVYATGYAQAINVFWTTPVGANIAGVRVYFKP
jgi:hypothetical protein